MSPKVLFVDDSATMRKVAEIAFAGSSYQFVVAQDAQEALGTIASFQPDVVLVDASLSGLSGYEVIAQARAQAPKTKWLLLTSAFHPYDEMQAQRVGASGYISKPFEIQNFLDKINMLVTSQLATEGMDEKTQIGIPVVHFSSALPSPPAKMAVSAPMEGAVRPSIPEPAQPETAAKENPVLPTMPRLPLLPRAPLPVSVVEALEQMARRGSTHEALATISMETIQRIAWEVVPELAEVLIREKLQQSIPTTPPEKI